MVALNIDHNQTRQIKPPKYETNPILGRHPHEDKINAYFGGWYLINTLVYLYGPEKAKDYWFISLIGIEVPVIFNNWKNHQLAIQISY